MARELLKSGCGKQLRHEVDLEKAAGSASEGRQLFNACAWSRPVHPRALVLREIVLTFFLSLIFLLSPCLNWFAQLWQHRHSIPHMSSTDNDLP